MCPECGGWDFHSFSCRVPGGGVASEVVNPITKTLVKLIPPIELFSSKEFTLFGDWLKVFFQAEWNQRRDPLEIDASGWRDDQADRLTAM